MADGSVEPRPTTTEAGARSRRLSVVLYCVVTWLYWTALFLYYPTLPTYVQMKTGNLASVGVVLSMYGLFQAIIRLPLGIVVDWVGWRKPFIVAGLVLAGAGAWLMGTAQGVTGLMIGRAIVGVSAGTWVLLIVVFSGLFPSEDVVRATAMLNLVGAVARVLSTSVTGTLNQWGGYQLSFFLAVGAAAIALVIVVPVPEVRRPPKRPSVRGIGRLITRRDVLLPSVLSALIQYANWSSSLAFLPILARQLGASDVTLSLLVGLGMAVITVGNLLATIIVRRIGARRLTSISFIGASTGILIASVAPTLPLLFVAQFCIGLFIAIGYPVLMGMSIEQVPDEERTTAMGLHQAVYAIGMFAGPWLGGMLADELGLRPMLAVTAVVCVIVGLLGARLLVRET